MGCVSYISYYNVAFTPLISSDHYFTRGVKLMELAEKAPQLFKMMNPSEKKEIVNLVLSNPQVKDATIRFHYMKPFSLFTNIVDLSKWRERLDEFKDWCREEFMHKIA